MAALASTGVLSPAPQAEPEFLVDRWTTADGLPVNAVQAVHRSPSGYLWMVTHDGLVRFDGHHFVTYSSPESGKRLSALYETPDGLLWVRNDVYRLSSFDGREFHRHGVADGLPPDTLVSVDQDPEGRLWALTRTALARRDGAGFRTVVELPHPDAQWQALPSSDDGAWIASRAGLYHWNGQALQLYGNEQGAPAEVESMALDDTGRVWAGGGKVTTRQLPDGRFETVADDCGAQRIDIVAGHVAIVCGRGDLYIDPAGNLTRRTRVPHFEANGRERLLGQAPDGSVWRNRIDALERDGRLVYAAPCPINDFDFDPDGSTWVATACEGLLRLRPRRISAVTELGGVRLGAVYGMAQDYQGTLWIATQINGVAALAPDGSVRWIANPGGHIQPQPVWTGTDGETWIGNCRVDKASSWRCNTPPDLPAGVGLGGSIRALHGSADGTFWVSGLDLWRRDPEGWWSRVDTGLARETASQMRVVLEVDDGTLWFGTRGNGLLRRDVDGSFHRITTRDGLASNAIRGLQLDHAGQLWIATEDLGLCRMQAGGAIGCLDHRHGLWSDSLHQILFDAGDRAWINSNQGVFAVARSELESVLAASAAGGMARIHPQVFTMRDGLPDQEGNGGVSGAGLSLADGRIVFPTQNGIAVIDPTRLRPSPTPVKAVIEDIDLPGGRRLAASQRVTLPRGDRSLTVHFTGLAPGLLQPLYFRYRLGTDTAWSELGEARKISLAHLPAGEHRLQLQAFGSGGEPEQTAGIELVVPPYFHETAAFRIALPLSMLLLLSVALLRHHRATRRRNAELEATVAERTGDLRQALDMVNRQRNEIADLAKSKNRFFANVSHEFRTPLTLISGPLRDAARGHPLSDLTRAVMLGNAKRIERLVTQLLDLERMDASRFPLNPVNGDISALVHETAQAFAPLARQQGIEFALDPPRPLAPVVLYYDPDQIVRILGNLLSNALKFTPERGRIAVHLVEEADNVRLVVADTGPGVPEDWRERIFDRFAQVGSEATRSREGAGLGLAVCREIAQLHGGRLWVEANVAGGARFVLELPRDRQQCLSSDAEERHPDPGTEVDEEIIPIEYTANVGRRRILVAEDHADLRAYIVSVLGDDHDVIQAEDGEAALQLARDRLPDLIVSDVMMPRRDGFSLARELRGTAETAGIPLIFLTARASDADEIAGLLSGADQYLRKPFDAARLRAHVASALHMVERLRRQFAATPHPPSIPLDTAGRRFLEAATQWLEANLHDDAATIQGMASALHVSRATLTRRYTGATGEAPRDALRRKRLERARCLLKEGQGTVSEVAYAVGYASLAAFSHAYRDRYGHPPSQD